MSVSLVEVAGANFRTDRESDALNTLFMERLGLRQRYQPARLAISSSLSTSSQPKSISPEIDYGKVIKGDALFGADTELSVWLAMIVQHQGNEDLDIKQLVSLVGAHWKRGLGVLEREWTDASESIPEFVGSLVSAADLSTRGRERKL